MSFFNSIHQLVSDAGSSINASARKLASSISQDSNGSNEPHNSPIVTPNIEVVSTNSAASSGKYGKCCPF